MHKISARRDYVCEGDELFGPKSKQGNTHEMKAKTTKAALFAAITGLAFAAFAANFDLPTPPPSPFPDTESSVNVAVTNWPGLGRRVKLTLSANFTPSNCVQIAFGQDTNADGDLAPGEVQIVLGVDCGVPFIREEVNVGKWRSGILSASVEDLSIHSTTTTTNYDYHAFTFTLKQPSAVSARFDFAKITTRGREETAAQIAAQITRPGTALILR